jgi:hypothetical protein
MSTPASLTTERGGLAVDARAPRWIRRGLQVAARWAPALGVRLALRLFFTPLPSKLAARARPLPATAGWQRSLLPFESGRIAVWTHADAKP